MGQGERDSGEALGITCRGQVIRGAFGCLFVKSIC